MPVYAQAEDLNNGLIPSGNVLPEQTGFDVALPEGANPEPLPPEPSVWGAAMRQNNILSGFFRPARQFEPVEGYNPYADKNELHGYEYWGRNLQIPDRQRKRRGLSSR